MPSYPLKICPLTVLPWHQLGFWVNLCFSSQRHFSSFKLEIWKMYHFLFIFFILFQTQNLSIMYSYYHSNMFPPHKKIKANKKQNKSQKQQQQKYIVYPLYLNYCCPIRPIKTHRCYKPWKDYIIKPPSLEGRRKNTNLN
jgi:hypothetical protein